MGSFLPLTRLTIALNFRNRMAIIYGYLFPIIFLFSFWAIYRHDQIPLALHLGEMLTVTILGGACFGLPTALVSERERGVWRRYRVTPVPTWVLMASTLAARFVLLLSAALIQIALAMLIGMPVPAHPLELLLAFAFASAAFLGLGMLIAMLANSVPAVQALGQCIFLPMLMIGGVAVRLSSLPDWALHLSAFFPGRYAVKALQDCTTGAGLGSATFDCAALVLIGSAAGLAATRLYRWDAAQRAVSRRGKYWIGVALGAWLFVGVAAEMKGRVMLIEDTAAEVPPPQAYFDPAPQPAPRPVAPSAPAPIEENVSAPKTEAPADVAPKAEPNAVVTTPPAGWEAVTHADIAQVAFERLPPDQGIVSPVANPGEEPDDAIAAQLDTVASRLPDWTPGQVDDPVQRVRNILYVAAVPDVLQMEQLERHLPLLVYERIRQTTPPSDLPKILYWIAMHPQDGEDSAIQQLGQLGLPEARGPTRTPRARVMLYAFKLLGRLTGDIKQ